MKLKLSMKMVVVPGQKVWLIKAIVDANEDGEPLGRR